MHFYYISFGNLVFLPRQFKIHGRLWTDGLKASANSSSYVLFTLCILFSLFICIFEMHWLYQQFWGLVLRKTQLVMTSEWSELCGINGPGIGFYFISVLQKVLCGKTNLITDFSGISQSHRHGLGCVQRRYKVTLFSLISTVEVRVEKCDSIFSCQGPNNSHYYNSWSNQAVCEFVKCKKKKTIGLGMRGWVQKEQTSWR